MDYYKNEPPFLIFYTKNGTNQTHVNISECVCLLESCHIMPIEKGMRPMMVNIGAGGYRSASTATLIIRFLSIISFKNTATVYFSTQIKAKKCIYEAWTEA